MSELEECKNMQHSGELLKILIFQPIFTQKVHLHICSASPGMGTIKFAFLSPKKRNICMYLELSKKNICKSVREVEFWELSPSLSHMKRQHFKHLGGCVSKGKSP